ncbi:hypothetical protein ACVWZL_004692 [Bradyrhizobium sp. GM2.4]
MARSMPSPIAATSRRMAWPTVTMESEAEPSGSEKRIATWAIACATELICWPRQTRLARKKNSMIGAKNIVTRPAMAKTPPLWPIAAWIDGRKPTVSAAQAASQMTVKIVAPV